MFKGKALGVRERWARDIRGEVPPFQVSKPVLLLILLL